MSSSHIIFDEKTQPSTLRIAFFCGTGYDFYEESDNYIDQKKLGYNELKAPDKITRDISFLLLDSIIERLGSPEIRALGYDGCHRRGGGINATGIEEPANHLYQHLKKLNKKTTLIITAHSRGCLSAYLVSKLINADKDLQQKVEIVLDLRDPVPGNLKGFSTLFGSFTSSGAFYDLTSCTNIKSANITIQETGILPVAFNVLIPKFANSTKVSLSALPGEHDVQETIYYGQSGLFYLGLCKSLQLYYENRFILRTATLRSAFVESYGFILKQLGERLVKDDTNSAIYTSQITLLNELLSIVKNPDYDALQILKTTQLHIYNHILNNYKKDPKRSLALRHIAFGGQAERSQYPIEEVSYFNAEHYALALESEPHQVHKYKLLYVLEGQKPHTVVNLPMIKPAQLHKLPAVDTINPPQSFLSSELKKVLENARVPLDSKTAELLEPAMQKLNSLREQAALFKNKDGKEMPVYQPLIDKIEKNMASIEKNLFTYLNKHVDNKAITSLYRDKFDEEKKRIVNLGQTLKKKTEIKYLKNKILKNTQDIIDYISEYKTSDPNTEIGKAKNALAADLKMRLISIKSIFANNSDVVQFKDAITSVINEIIDNLSKAGINKASSVLLTAKRDTSVRFSDILLNVKKQAESLSPLLDSMKELVAPNTPVSEASMPAAKSTGSKRS